MYDIEIYGKDGEAFLLCREDIKGCRLFELIECIKEQCS